MLRGPIIRERVLRQRIEDEQSRDTESNGADAPPTRQTCGSLQRIAIEMAQRRKSPGCRQETLTSGNARSATRVHFFVMRL